MLTAVAHAMECTVLFVMSIELNHQITAHILLPALVLWVDSQWLPVHPLCQRWVEWGLLFYSFCFYGSTCSQERRRNVRLDLLICIYLAIWTVVTVTAVIWWPKAPWPSQPSTQGWAVISHVQGGCLSARTAQNHPMYLFLQLLLRQKGFQRLHLFPC
jgi:hypothetical protein